MALFKLEKGLAANLNVNRPNTVEGYCYVTTDDGKFYIDTATGNGTSKRIVLNAGTADKTKGSLTLQTPEGKVLGTFNGQENTIIEVGDTTEGLSEPIVLSEDISYGSVLPEEGEEGQLFFLEGDTMSVPAGGTTGQVLAKSSAEDGDTIWVDIQELPEGGTAGQILAKNSATNGDAEWVDTQNNIIAYAICTTAAATAAKVATIQNNDNWELKVGSIIAVKISNTNTANSNITLNINGTGAKSIYYNNTQVGSSYYGASLTAGLNLYVYDGTGYVWMGRSVDNNSDTKVTQTVVDPSEITYYYLLGGTSSSSTTATAIKSAAARLAIQEGTADTVGRCYLWLGNSTASGTAGNKRGGVGIYGDSTGYNYLTATASTSNFSNYLPAKSGTLVNNNIAAATTKAYVMGVSATGSTSATVTANSGVYTSGSVLYGAAYNDYAEYRELREDIEIPYGRVVIENGDDTLSLSTKRLQGGGNICSDTFGFAIGETDKAKMPIAVSGRALVYPYESIEEFKNHIGWPVCSGPNGTVSIMTEEEEAKYPSRIIGTISAIPTYEFWGENNIEVKGRIWIKVG